MRARLLSSLLAISIAIVPLTANAGTRGARIRASSVLRKAAVRTAIVRKARRDKSASVRRGRVVGTVKSRAGYQIVDETITDEMRRELDRLMTRPSAEMLRDAALLPDVYGPLAERAAEPMATPDGKIRLIDGRLVSHNSKAAMLASRALMAESPRTAVMKGARHRSVLIDGGGPTGALAAIHAFRLGLDVTIVESRTTNSLPIVWNNRPQTRDILHAIDPALEKKVFSGVAGTVRSGEYQQAGKPPVVGNPDRNPAINRRVDPRALTNQPRVIASTPSTYNTQAKGEVELYWSHLTELATIEEATAKFEGRAPRLRLLRGYQISDLPVDGNRRAVVVQKLGERLQRVDLAGKPIMRDGQPIFRPYDPSKKIPAGYVRTTVPIGIAERIAAPDDLLIAEGSNSRTRTLAGSTSIDVGPNTRFIAGFLKDRRILSRPGPDGLESHGVIRRELKVIGGRALRHIAISPENLSGTWALPEVDGRLDFKSPASIESYFGVKLSEKEAILRYYAQEIAPLIGLFPNDLTERDFEFGPGPFVLQSHVSGPVAADASNVHLIGDAAGNSHFLTSLGKVTGTGTHQLSLRHYWTELATGANERLQSAILDRRLQEGTRTWIKAGLKEFDTAGGGNLGKSAVDQIGKNNAGSHFEVNSTRARYESRADPTVNN